MLKSPTKPTSARARRELLATLAADSARKKYRDDVLTRKMTIASGEGVVHGQMFNLDDWGFAVDPR